MLDATNGNKWQHLSIKQESAIDLLVTGKTDIEVAEAVGVNRVTVTKWRNYHPGFQAELNRRRQNLWGAAVERLRSLVAKALDVVAEQLDAGDDRFRASVQVLKLAGLDCFDPPAGSSEPQQIVDELVQARIRAKVAERNRYQSDEERFAELMDRSRARARDEAEAEEARKEVLVEIEQCLANAKG